MSSTVRHYSASPPLPSWPSPSAAIGFTPRVLAPPLPLSISLTGLRLPPHSVTAEFPSAAFGFTPKVVVTDQDQAMKNAIEEVGHHLSMFFLFSGYVSQGRFYYILNVESYMSKADEVQVVAPAPSKRDRIAEMVGHSVNEKYPVRVPVGNKTKGCGAYKRLKSKQEEAISKAGKKSRQC
ncbi:hypothetical protein L1987_33167 [Smallanthus sonchifolius]|uniref:Uncharacterized protein n=1 Tax=Smallanthus sonchifolius TaxID=185202 RepID=A0ACB9HPL9_9ASTR|nr:hypothetical protein L1987_33167 [Smallanthus sonchifolius]